MNICYFYIKIYKVIIMIWYLIFKLICIPVFIFLMYKTTGILRWKDIIFSIIFVLLFPIFLTYGIMTLIGMCAYTLWSLIDESHWGNICVKERRKN